MQDFNSFPPCSCFLKSSPHLNRKEDPLVNRMGLGLGLGSSKSLKKAWYSTQIFQKTLQQSLLAMVNSSVSWWAFCCRDAQAEISMDERREEGKMMKI